METRVLDYENIDESNDDDLSIYSKNVREMMLEDDELSPFEEAFMNGYEGDDW